MTDTTRLPVHLSEDDLVKLTRGLAARLDEDALLDAANIGALLKFSESTVTSNFAKGPFFPTPIHLAGRDGHRSRPRWRRGDVVAWINAHVERRPGRQRKIPFLG